MDKLPDDVRNELYEFFNEYRVVYLATAGGTQPRVRPVTMNYIDGKFWILTGTNDAKVGELNANPGVEACAPVDGSENKGYYRMSGKAIVVTDPETRAAISEKVDYFKNYWKTPEDPTYTLLEIDVKEVDVLKPGEMLANRYLY